MHQTTALVRTPDGAMDSVIVRRDQKHRSATVILFHDIYGLDDQTRAIATRIASEGYCCAVPNLYYRLGKTVLHPEDTAPVAATIRRAAAGSLRNWDTMNDTRALFDFLSADPAIGPGRRAVIGYGAGGRFALLAAGQFAAEIGAAASIYGTGLVTESPDSPHLMLHKLQGALYCSFAGRDPMVPAAKIEEFQDLVNERCSTESLIEVHAGTRQEAAASSWQRVFEIFSRRLA